MKNLKLTLFTVFMTSFLSCSKDDDNVASGENVFVPLNYATVATVAGTANSDGFQDGIGTAAKFDGPIAVAIDSQGNLFVVDNYNDVIRKITPNGTVTTIITTGITSPFSAPTGIVVDNNDNIFLSDAGNDNIIKITPSGVASVFAGSSNGYQDGSALIAQFNNPRGLAIDDQNNIYVADSSNRAIRKITPNGTVSTIIQVPSPPFQCLDLVFGIDGNLYVADRTGKAIHKITVAGVKTTYADGFRTENGVNIQNFTDIYAIDTDKAGNLYVADHGKHQITKINVQGEVSKLAGSTAGEVDGTIMTAKFANPIGLAVKNNGEIYVTDYYGNTIRKIME
ncbi:hypothetical protein FIA58_017035 [Flavobacterium jejuense]|uniref:Teneurin NHL domain-containing protein n=1 Tax=Flavobacterium jejuense TaxID=1544455 RepID=A0ABX0IX87_9FLAO|nr:hypothetical protein [Flavobacterium jejuense]NHN27387.1 hypothetical protein [Flavobacterium jejuense]